MTPATPPPPAALRVVTVNTRSLIDKILARYSSEFTLFRELVQNADDAGAALVTIAFETTASKEGPMLARVVISNNGAPFAAADWQRIVSIADGNPDETKIGFFGVGFFSVFSVCESPIVSSGDRQLQFEWQENQLFYKDGARPQPYDPSLTSVALEWRPSSRRPPPTAESFANFASQLLCFTRNLRNVIVTVNGKSFVSAGRVDEEKTPLSFAPVLMQKLSVANPSLASSAPLNNVASLWRNFFSATGALTTSTPDTVEDETPKSALSLAGGQDEATVCRSLLVCTVAGEDEPRQTHLVRAFAAFSLALPSDQAEELLRITKKRPSKRVALQVLVPCAGPLNDRSGVSPKGGRGRVFIGFATRQSTGCSAHVNGPFIPTMERDLLDFADAAVGAYNKLLLQACGVLMGALHQKLCADPALALQSNGKHPFELAVQPEDKNVLSMMFKSLQSAVAGSDALSEGAADDAKSLPVGTPAPLLACAHSLSCFAPVGQSSPAPLVGQTLFTSAFASSLSPSPVIWTRAKVLVPAKDARVATLGETEFLGDVGNVVVDVLVKKRPADWASTCALASQCVASFVSMGLLKALDHDDIIRQLQKSPLKGMDAFSKFVHWVESTVKPACRECHGALNRECAVCGQRERALVQACTVLNAWPDTPDVACSPAGWRWIADRSLSVVPMPLLDAVVERHRLLAPSLAPRSRLLPLSPMDLSVFAVRALNSDPSNASGVLLALSQSTDANVVKRACALLTDVDCVPTQLGLVVPRVAVLDVVAEHTNLGLNAPVVDAALLALHPAMRDFLLQSLGVRRTPSAALVLESYSRGTLQWDCVQLIGFLSQVAEPDYSEAVAALRTMRFLPRALDPDPSRLYMAKELINPTGVADALKLDVPCLKWPGAFEKSMLALLVSAGLTQQVPMDMLVSVAANSTRPREVRLAAVSALAARCSSSALSPVASSPLALTMLPIIPCKGGLWSAPSRCFLEAGPFPFSETELESSVALSLGVHSRPSAATIVDCLTQRADLAADKAWDRINYLAFKCANSNELTSDHLSRLSRAALVPHQDALVAPSKVFFSTSPTLRPLFPLINPDDHAPVVVRLLRMLGVRDAPTASELAAQFAKDPEPLLESVGQQAYLDLLRMLAADWSSVDTPSRTKLAGSSCMLGQVEEGKPMVLLPAKQIALNDDLRLHRLFPEQATVPMESLEDMYMSLGAKELSKLVTETFAFIDAGMSYSSQAALVDARIKERAAVLLGKMPPNVLSSRVKSAWLKPMEKGERLVMQVSGIKSTLKLGARSLDVKTTSCVTKRDVGILLVTGEFDWFDVASALAKDWLVESIRSKDRALLWSDLLASSLESLENKGFVVKRKPKPAEPVKALVAPASASSQNQMNLALASGAAPNTVGDAVGTVGSGALPSLPSNGAPGASSPPAAKSEPKSSSAAAALNGAAMMSKPAPAAAVAAPPLPRPVQAARPSQLPSLPAGMQAKDLIGMVPPALLAKAASSMLSTASAGGPVSTPQVRSPPLMQQLGARGSVDSEATRKQTLARALQGCVGGEGPSGIQQPPTRLSMAPAPAPLDDLHAHDVLKLPVMVGGLEMYVERSSDPAQVERNMEQVKVFARLLIGLGVEVFTVDPDAVKVYWDAKLTTAAFNNGRGMLFFNACAFCTEGKSAEIPSVVAHWWGVFAHELAHNTCTLHDAAFAHAQEMILVETFTELVRYLDRRGMDLP